MLCKNYYQLVNVAMHYKLITLLYICSKSIHISLIFKIVLLMHQRCWDVAKSLQRNHTAFVVHSLATLLVGY